MKQGILITMAAAALAAGAAVPALAGAPGALSGEYVEARTASVFAGACHFGGEVTTTGREAEMAWHVEGGTWKGVSLDGLTAMAAVVAGHNLRDDVAGRRSVIYIDSRATPAQAAALADALKSTCGASLGTVVGVKLAPITFRRSGASFDVQAPGVGGMVVQPMPNAACCKQPNLVWYKPLVELRGRRVGYTVSSRIHEPALGTSWKYDGQNTAFYGHFAL